VFDEQGTLVALIAEDYTGLGNEVGRQLLRTRRSFSATVLSADGSQVIFRVRRPMYLVTSTMFIEDGAGQPIGEVHRRWSMLNRNYDLYMHKAQFASITGNFLAWEFELKDVKAGTLAFIDRNFQGFGKEIFTDAGKYVIHFGMPADEADKVAANLAAHKAEHAALVAETAKAEGKPAPAQTQAPAPPVTPLALARTGVAVIPTVAGNELQVARPMELDERMVTLACAISIDYDFFSQHSSGHGLAGGMMPMMMPIPLPGMGGGGDAEGGAGGVAGGAAAGAAGGVVDGGGAVPEPGMDAPQQSDGGDSGWGMGDQGGGAQEQGAGGWGGNDEEMKWDDGAGESSGGGEGEGGGVLGTLWEWVSGGGE
jgi:uncharacterized protein YxjI